MQKTSKILLISIITLAVIVLLYSFQWYYRYHSDKGVNYWWGSLLGKFDKRGPDYVIFPQATSNGNFKKFSKSIWAQDLGAVNSITYDYANQRLFASDPINNQIIVYADTDQDQAETAQVFIDNIDRPYGLTFADNHLYITTAKQVIAAKDLDANNVPEEIVVLADDLTDGMESIYDIEIGPDGFLYLGLGPNSLIKDFKHSGVLSGTILRMNPQTGAAEVMAQGFGHPIDLAWHPANGELLVGDRYSLKPGKISDELNVVFPGQNYGWPWCDDKGNNCDESVPPLLKFDNGSRIAGLAFNYYHQFPDEFRNNLFMVFRGASNGDPRVTHGIYRADLVPIAQGYDVQLNPFALGFTDPIDIAFNNEGIMFVADHTDGIIYRIKADYK